MKLGQEEENFVVVFAPPQLFQNEVVLIVLFTKKFEDEFGNVLVVNESDEVYFGAFFNFVGLIKSQKGKYVRTVTCQRGFSEIESQVFSSGGTSTVNTYESYFQDTKLKTTEDNDTKKNDTKTANKRNFNAVPTRTLNISSISSSSTKPRDWLSKSDAILKSAEKKSGETRRQRKKRLWLERQQSRKSAGGKNFAETSKKQLQKFANNGGDKDWGYLPDIALEIIFQYLPFEVSPFYVLYLALFAAILKKAFFCVRS